MGTYGNSVVIVLANECTSWISVTKATDSTENETSGCGGTLKPMSLRLPKVRTAGEFAAIVLEHAQLTTLESFRVSVTGDMTVPYKVLIAHAVLEILRAEKVLYIGQNVAVRVALIAPNLLPGTEDEYGMDTSPCPLIMMDEGKVYLRDNAEPSILYEDMQAFSTWGLSSRKMKHLIREGDDRLYYEEKIEKFLDQLTFRVLRSDSAFSGKYSCLTGNTGVGSGRSGSDVTPLHMGTIARHGYLYVGNARGEAKLHERMGKLKKVIELEQANLDRKKRGDRPKFTYDTVWEARKLHSTTVQINEELKRREDKIKEKWRRYHVLQEFLRTGYSAPFQAEYLVWIGALILNNSSCGGKFGDAVTFADWKRDGAQAVGDPHDISISDKEGKGNEVWFDVNK